jgi:hypothetical protein
MFRRPNKILLAAGVAVTVIAAMAGPAGARTSAGGQASTPVPVDVTGDMTWTYVYTPLGQGQSGNDTQTVTAHIGLTGLNPVSGQATGNTSTYSLTDNLNETTVSSQGCKIQLTGSFSSGGTVAMNGTLPTTNPAYGGVTFNADLTQAQVGVHISYAEAQTTTFSGGPSPYPCPVPGASTSTVDLQANPGCYPNTGPILPGGPLQGTYPDATVNLGCSATGGNNLWREDTTVTGNLTVTPSCGSGATSSLTPASSSSTASARSAVPASASSSSNSCPVHYTVTVEQWIPQSSVVDPGMPLPVPYENTVKLPAFYILDPNCLQPPLPNGIYSSIVRSSYHGDGHTDFGGSYREEFEIEFDFDGQSITNFKEDTPQTGTTIRNKTYTAHGSVIASCSTQGKATPTVAAAQTGDTTFTMSSAGKNPLTPPALTPSFSTALSGSLDGNGDLQLSGSMTDFPSQGIQVTENGQPVLTDIANDVSCLSASQVTGLQGVFNLTRGLLSSHNVDATASGAPLSEDNPSPLC